MRNHPALNELRRHADSGAVVGIKVETESEGLPWLRIGHLAALASAAGVEFAVKVGGCEAKTDLKNCDELGVTSVVVPMVETVFAADKFRASTEAVFEHLENIRRYVLIESHTGVSNSAEIIEFVSSWAAGINVGRSDLAASMSLADGRRYGVDDAPVISAAATVLARANNRGLLTTMGGRLTPASITAMIEQAGEAALPRRVETRRFILDFAQLRSRPGIVEELLRIELALAEDYAGVINRRNLAAFNYAEEIRARFKPAPPKIDVL